MSVAISQGAGTPGDAGQTGAANGAVNSDILAALREVMENGFSHLVGIFLQETPKLLDAVREGIAAGNIESVHRNAHSIKSSSASLGALGLSELARSLETLARGGSLDGAAALAGQMRAELVRVEEALRHEIG